MQPYFLDISLNNLKINSQAKILEVNNTGSIRRRLLDLGLVNNSTIVPVLESPSKGLKAFDIRETLIAIRDEDAGKIIVKKIN